jgi:hypothetical protein
METYVRDHSDADFSHSVCPTCLEDYYPDYAHGTDGTGGEGR